MAKFKVGDRIRLTADNGGFGSNGDTGTIIREPDYVRFDRKIDRSTDWYVDPDNIEPAPKFAVGDRVRWLRVTDRFQNAKVVDYDIKPWLYKIQQDNGEYTYASDDELAPVAEQHPLTIQAGRYYKTRDGRKVGPMEVTLDGEYWTPNDGRYHYNNDGTRRFGEDDETVVIAEWPTASNAAAEVDNMRDEYGPYGDMLDGGIDGPYNEPVNDNGKPKFKVGDRVRVTDPSLFRVGTRVGDLGTVTSDYYGKGNDYVDIDLYHSTEGKIDQIARPEHIELAPDSKLIITMTADTSALDAEIDRVKRRLKKLAKRARKLGIRLDYDLAA